VTDVAGPTGGSFISLTSATSQERFGLDSSLVSIGRLFERRSVALLQETELDASDGAWDYVQGGYTAPAWITKAANVSVTSSANKAFTFGSGLLMLAPSGLSLEGSAYDNPSLLAACRQGDFSFPDSSLGRQLRQVAGLLASDPGGQRVFVASLGGSLVVGDAAAQRAARFRVLSEAMVALQDALDQMRMGSSVATFTDSDVRLISPRERTRLVMGRNVLGGEVYHLQGSSGTQGLAEWAGYGNASSSDVRFVY
jgi:hypothetical protein